MCYFNINNVEIVVLRIPKSNKCIVFLKYYLITHERIAILLKLISIICLIEIHSKKLAVR